MDETYTAEQLREEALSIEREGRDADEVDSKWLIGLLRAHADALDRLARIEAAHGNDVREVAQMCAAASRDERLADGALYRNAAALLESLSAKLAEAGKFKEVAELLYDRYEEGTSCYEYSDGQQGSYIGNAVLLTGAEESSIVALLNGGQNSPSPMQVLLARAEKAEEELAKLKAHRIGLNDDGSLDEVVGAPAHLEQMDDEQWFALIGDVAVFLTSQSPIQATYERRDYPEGTT